MLIKYNPAKLLAEQLVANTLSEKAVNLSPATEKKLFGTANSNLQYKNSTIDYAPIYVAGLQVNVTAERIQHAHHLVSNPTGSTRYHLKDENGIDLTSGKIIDNTNIDKFFRSLYIERKQFVDSPRPN